MITLRGVLDAFEAAQGTVRLDQLSRDLGLDPATLDSMIQHWVRKGRIREISARPSAESRCGPCGVKSECPLIASPLKRYMLVRADDSLAAASPSACSLDQSSRSH